MSRPWKSFLTRRVAVPLEIAPPRRFAADATVVAFGGPTMGVEWSVKAVGRPDFDPSAAQVAIQALLNALVRQMSPWEPASDISRFNRAPAGSWLDLPPPFREVMERGLHWAQASGGAFDPTLGRLTDLWGFGPPGAVARPPSDPEIETAMMQGGWDRLPIDDGRMHQPGGLELDLSGIAKGFAVDEVSRALNLLGAPDHLVEIGGELRGCGAKPDGQPWWVEVAPPPGMTLPRGPIAVALHGLAIASSGTYRRGFDHGGVRYAHTLDPRTGRPVQNALCAISVIAPACIDADALCTAIAVLGPEDGAAFASAHDVAAYLLIENAHGAGEIVSPALAAMLA